MRDHTMGTMIRLGGIISVDEKMIADARLMSEETAASWGLKTLKSFDEWEANVIRIVACWNACNGLPTEKLEQHNIGYVIGEAEGERSQAEPFLLEQIRKLEAERDELRAALEKISTIDLDARGAATAIKHISRAALAKYEEKK